MIRKNYLFISHSKYSWEKKKIPIIKAWVQLLYQTYWHFKSGYSRLDESDINPWVQCLLSEHPRKVLNDITPYLIQSSNKRYPRYWRTFICYQALEIQATFRISISQEFSSVFFSCIVFLHVYHFSNSKNFYWFPSTTRMCCVYEEKHLLVVSSSDL